ncbi:hypothetical protein CsSME_00043671 [Camellia sinensis var. sinensis]
MGYTEDMPHVYHWASRREAGSSIDHLKSFRAELDSLVATDCLDVVEPYHPDRVLRQFGRVQTIPDAPLAPSRGARGNISARYTVMYRYLDRMWEAWDNHVLSAQRRSTPAIESMTHVLEGQHIDEAGPSSAGPSSAGGRFPSSTLTYSRRPRRRHTADS